jgi:hypothetical protein
LFISYSNVCVAKSPALESLKTGLITHVAAGAIVVCILLASSCMTRITGSGNETTAREGRILRPFDTPRIVPSRVRGRQALHDERSWCHAGFAFLVTAVVLASVPVIAQEAWTPPAHVRPERGVTSLVEEASRRSPFIRELIDRLEGLDVTVYIRSRVFLMSDLEGRIALLSAAGSHRYLVIELACGRNGFSQMATLGHELYHATEIAAEPSIVDPQTLAAFYTRIGTQTNDNIGRRTFETQAAADAGRRTRRELLSSSTRNAHGT